MPSLNLSNRTIRYAASDETALAKAATLLSVVAEFDADEQAKRDAKSALVGITALVKHVAAKRNGKTETA